MIFKYIKAARFFPDYCPSVKNWKHKLRGKDGNGKDLHFSKSELKEINAGVNKLFKELKTIKTK